LVTTISFYVSSILGAIPATAGAVTNAYLLDGSVTAAKMAPNGAWAPAGTVLQVVNVAYSTAISTSSTSYTDTGLTATITPKFATSKILAFVDITGTQKGGLNGALGLQLVRNSTSILLFESVALYTSGTVSTNAVGACSTNYLDSPATTSATTYKVQYKAFEGTVYVNSVYSGSQTSSTITLMEIAQ
jgi:hypothetical protein